MNELVCKNCGANLQMDEKKDILYCPYCGTVLKEEESDKIKIAKIIRGTINDIGERRRKKHEEDQKTGLIALGVLLIVFLALLLFNLALR